MDPVYEPLATICIKWLVDTIPHEFLLSLIGISSLFIILLIIILIIIIVLCIIWLYLRTTFNLTTTALKIYDTIRQLSPPHIIRRLRRIPLETRAKTIAPVVKPKVSSSSKILPSTTHRNIDIPLERNTGRQTAKKSSIRNRVVSQTEDNSDDSVVYLYKKHAPQEIPNLARPFLRYRNHLYIRCYVPPGLDIWDLFPEDKIPPPPPPKAVHSRVRLPIYPSTKTPPSPKSSSSDSSASQISSPEHISISSNSNNVNNHNHIDSTSESSSSSSSSSTSSDSYLNIRSLRDLLPEE